MPALLMMTRLFFGRKGSWQRGNMPIISGGIRGIGPDGYLQFAEVGFCGRFNSMCRMIG